MHDPTGFRFSQRAARTHEQPIGYLMAQAVGNPRLISLAAGLVDYPTLPVDDTRQILDAILADPCRGQIALQYGTTEGLAELREELLKHLANLDGVTPAQLGSADDLLITTGSQQLLFTITDVLVDPGDIVITEWPSYFVYTGALASFGARVRCVEIDDQGLIPEKLDALLGELRRAGELSRVKIVYTCDDHQNPTGITLSETRRRAVLEVVQRYSTDHRILLLEDAAYRELTYEGSAPHTIRRFDESGETVALLQTFSKPFSPGVKTGYGLLPRSLVEAVSLQKGGQDFGSANLVQHLLREAMTRGVYARHVRLLCENYAKKRDAMLSALQEHLGDFEPGTTRWTHPNGGLYVWLTLPERFDTGRSGSLFRRAIDEGVLYVPGVYCYPADEKRTPPRNAMRLSFGVPNLAKIHEGIARLARAIRAMN